MFLYGHWVRLPLTTRQKIAADFNIIKRGSTEVFNNEIKSDGYNLHEVEQALSVDALQKYTSSNDTDMMILWEKMVEKAEGREVIALPKTKKKRA